MANAIYDKYKEALISGGLAVALNSGNLKVSLVDSDVTSFGSTDEFYADLNSVTGIVATNGVLDADDVVFESVADTTPQSEALLFWIDTGNTATSRLVAWLDTNIDGFPITPDGSNVDITWSTSGIFKL